MSESISTETSSRPEPAGVLQAFDELLKAPQNVAPPHTDRSRRPAFWLLGGAVVAWIAYVAVAGLLREGARCSSRPSRRHSSSS